MAADNPDAKTNRDELEGKLQRTEARLISAESELSDARKSLEHFRAESQRARSDAHRARSEAMTLSNQLNDVYRSLSWRLTRPIRSIRPLLVPLLDFSNGGWQALRNSRKLSSFSRLYARRDRAVRMTDAERAALVGEYSAKALDREPDSFILYRIIGNDLYPRHKKGQSRENVRFIINNEPELATCEKAWIVNRIIDPEEELAIVELLEKHQQRYLRLPFNIENYGSVGWDFEIFPNQDFFLGKEKLGPERAERAEVAVRRFKNNYVMNNNGGRNTALRDGRHRAKWVLPWDGNCFIHANAWEEILRGVQEQPYLKYFVVPMTRITENQSLLIPKFEVQGLDQEPQILFRRDAAEEFDEEFCYGRRPKVELFWRLQIPGIWDRWPKDPWDLPRPELSKEARQFGYAGWVARLDSGRGALEDSGLEALRGRGLARNAAIITTLDSLDHKAFAYHFDCTRLMSYEDSKIEQLQSATADGACSLAAALREHADCALARGPYSVIDKSTVAPSGDVHDYWHPAPYWWPNPESANGLPYVWRDGERVPGTELHEPGSEQFDRTRLQLLFDDTTVLALAWAVSKQERYAEHAAQLVRRWFLDPASRMNPHLRYAQVRMGHANNEGAHWGIIEMKDFYFFLDAVRLLERSNALDTQERAAFREWLRTYLDWLVSSKAGLKECQSPNNHGTCFDLQVAAIAAFLGDISLLIATFRRSRARVLQQVESDGRQPHELARPIPQHYSCFNLQCWVNLADIAARCGDNLWTFTGRECQSIKAALGWVLSEKSTIGAENSFDQSRLLPLYFAYRDHQGEAVLPKFDKVSSRYNHKPIFFSHDGIKPYWMLT